MKTWLEQEYNGWRCTNAKAVVEQGAYARFGRAGTDEVLEVPPAQIQADPVLAWNQFRALADKTDARIGRAEKRDAAPAEPKAKH